MFADITPPTGTPRGLGLLAACPICQTSYNHVQTQVMAERDDAHLLFLECRQCGSALLALVTMDPNGVSSFGTLTDLTKPEVATWPDAATVGINELLSFHHWLSTDPTFSFLL